VTKLDISPWRQYLAAFDRYLKTGSPFDRGAMHAHLEALGALARTVPHGVTAGQEPQEDGD
jgi:hypothetical protein